MQIATAEILLSGSPFNSVIKHGLTPAELVVIRHIHGPDAVKSVVVKGDKDIDPAAERDRIASIYGKAVGPDDQPTADFIARKFGGFEPNLPATFTGAGIEHTNEVYQEPTPVKKKRQVKKKPKAEDAPVQIIREEPKAAEDAGEEITVTV